MYSATKSYNPTQIWSELEKQDLYNRRYTLLLRHPFITQSYLCEALQSDEPYTSQAQTDFRGTETETVGGRTVATDSASSFPAAARYLCGREATDAVLSNSQLVSFCDSEGDILGGIAP